MLTVKCPICKKLVSWKGNPYRPFCSERCKLMDLGAWASGEYHIPVEKVKYERKSESEEKD